MERTRQGVDEWKDVRTLSYDASTDRPEAQPVTTASRPDVCPPLSTLPARELQESRQAHPRVPSACTSVTGPSTEEPRPPSTGAKNGASCSTTASARSVAAIRAFASADMAREVPEQATATRGGCHRADEHPEPARHKSEGWESDGASTGSSATISDATSARVAVHGITVVGVRDGGSR
ncbi:uncharacterized protein B0H18DRAFT_1126492 [Fomitopsis serialis]|uniref:uncharacterized protein n=1 Tax=Fomitopsis serialis TaxID=139415 RepID=UPI002007622E|nr:uncharacterized protein B0H18DRAFT_1126492 [Neoantrodia serialis]KAH9913210.1 hypothetical protein B0H18DRAFT_1126492 [Neoantrodia serialis]